MLLPVGDEPRWLRDVDLLLEITVEECRFDVHAVDVPAAVHHQSEDQPHRLEPRHRHKDFLEVHPCTLHIALHDDPVLMHDNGVMLIFLHLVDPHEADGVVSGRKRRECPHVFLIDGLELVQHHPAQAILVLYLGEHGRLLPSHQMHHLVIEEVLHQLWLSSRGAKEVINEAEAMRGGGAIVGVEQIWPRHQWHHKPHRRGVPRGTQRCYHGRHFVCQHHRFSCQGSRFAAHSW